MVNITSLHNISQTAVPRNLNPAVTTFATLSGCWIIVSHSTISFCFFRNRSKPWTAYSKQILSLSINDLLVGISALSLIVQFIIQRKNYITCSLSFYLYTAALSANLYHVFAICIFRSYKLIRQSPNTDITSTALASSLIIFAWIVAFGESAAIFIAWGKNQKDIPICVTEAVFSDRQSVPLFLAISYTIPVLGTNLIYALICCRLFTSLRKKVRLVPPSVHSSKTFNTETTLRHSQRANLIVQQQAMGTIGLLLLFLNLFTLPFIYMTFSEYSDIRQYRNIKVLLSNLLMINAAITPFIYVFRTKYLRDSLRDLLKEILPKCHR